MEPVEPVQSGNSSPPTTIFSILFCQSCGGGTKRRVRDCLAGYSCEGDAEEVVECNEDSCPAFSQWSPWSQCTQSCGGGSRQRERHCEAGGEPVCDCQCYGPIQEFESCGATLCPEWSPWSSWSSKFCICGGANWHEICTKF